MTDNIKDKVVVITGASSGLGALAINELADVDVDGIQFRPTAQPI